MIYFIQVTIYTALLFVVYLLFLKNRTDHRWSRAYLLMNMVLPFLLPYITLPALQNNSNTVRELMLPAVTIGGKVATAGVVVNWLPIIYFAISCTLLGYLAAQFVRILLFIRKHKADKQNGHKLLRDTGMGPGSWFNYIFIPGWDTDMAILDHERAHVTLRHSYDILLMRLLQCLAWPNLFLFVIAKELKTVHEFQADEAAGLGRKDYSETLLNSLFHTKHFSLSHTFFHHPIKRRIMMLQKKKSHPAKVKAATLFLLMITGMLYIQCSKDTLHNATTNAGKSADINGVYPEVDKLPVFVSSYTLINYIALNLKYPQQAKDHKIEGRVEIRFIIDENGEMKNPVVVKSPDQSLSDAVLAVVNTMDKWKPAEVKGKKVKAYFTLPVEFKMDMPEQEPYDAALRKQMLIGNGKQETMIFANGGC